MGALELAQQNHVSVKIKDEYAIGGFTSKMTLHTSSGVDLGEVCRGCAPPPPPEMKSSLYYLPHQSVMLFLSGAPLLRNILDSPMIFTLKYLQDYRSQVTYGAY